MKKKVNFRGREYIVETLPNDKISIDGETFSSEVKEGMNSLYKVTVEGQTFTIEVKGNEFIVDGETSKIEVKPYIEKRSINQDMTSSRKIKITAPIPGKVLQILVEEGQSVVKDQELLILEAMKMRNRIFATDDGVIKKIHIEPDTNVNQDQLLIEILTK